MTRTLKATALGVVGFIIALFGVVAVRAKHRRLIDPGWCHTGETMQARLYEHDKRKGFEV